MLRLGHGVIVSTVEIAGIEIGDEAQKEAGMIYRPFTDLEGVASGLWWSDNPYEEYGPNNKAVFMDLDRTVAKPLAQDTFDFVARHWAVARGKIEEIGDVFQGFDTYDIVVSEKVAEVIERFEPGMHDLVPIPNAWSLGSQQRIERKLFFLNVHATARTIDMERSWIDWVVRKNDGQRIPFLDTISRDGCFVYPDVEEKRCLWRDDIVTHQVFMSGALKEALVAANVRGFDFTECTALLH